MCGVGAIALAATMPVAFARNDGQIQTDVAVQIGDPIDAGPRVVCVVPDSGGTAEMPPAGCGGYQSADEVHMILDGLPPNTEIFIDASHLKFGLTDSGPGGSLGGEFEKFTSILQMNITATGELGTFNRLIGLPVQCETHIGPRNPGDPVQDFDNAMWALEGELFGDPDFCTFRVRAGDSFGLPSPGHTTLTRQGPPGSDFVVDSFFDIEYRIDYQGCPGSVLEGMSGTTQATIRMRIGDPGCGVDAASGACAPTSCPVAGQTCSPTCVNFDPNTGATNLIQCDCRDGGECQVDLGVGVPAARGFPVGCVQPNAAGTVVLPPPGCPYVSPDDLHVIIAGLPAGTHIEIGATHDKFFNIVETPGGTLGGNRETFQSILFMDMNGFGPPLDGFNRFIAVPIQCEVHTGPRTPGDAVQDFDSRMFILFGELFGDPDFDLIRVRGGTNFGLPSPGHTTLTRLGPPGSNFAVDSFFDITYEIEFQGAPGSVLDGFAGTTTGTIRMGTGGFPDCIGSCLPGEICNRNQVVQADGTIDICCECVPDVLDCTPTADGLGCTQPQCPVPPPDAICQPRCVVYDPATGVGTVSSCDCRGQNECHVLFDPALPARELSPECEVTASGGTVDLPPDGCPYLSPDDVHVILDGLPPNTEIHFDAAHDRFLTKTRTPGGTLGGEVEVFSSVLEMNVQGVGVPLNGFNRFIPLPIDCEVHTGPRTPGDPVQTFPNDMFRLEGELFGDPDFCLLKITGGTGNGLPSPGQTTLTQNGGNFSVDSFFDITYRIDYQGCPGSALEGMGGSTTATIRMATGGAPTCVGDCLPGEQCVETRTPLGDGTGRVEVCCDCVPALATGACCLQSAGCVEVSAADCATFGGMYQGDGTSCQPTVACCLPDGTCIDTAELCCIDQGGTPNFGTVCFSGLCQQCGTCGDLNNSGGPVDLNDFLLFAGCFNVPPTAACACADLNGDLIVDLNDFLIFAGIFGSSSTNFPPNCP